MTRIVFEVYVTHPDDTSTLVGTYEFTEEVDYDQVDDTYAFQLFKTRVGYRMQDGFLEIGSDLFPLAQVKRIAARVLLKERLG
ncbi:hypothetical protein G20c_100 [Thermus phage G20c]|nr:hypothetical protein G20c_100 [Thermus phage G20c]